MRYNIGRRIPPPTEVEARKFRNLKILVLWLQKEQRVSYPEVLYHL